MTTERDLIYEAETVRAAGRLKEAIAIAKGVGKIEPETISSLPPDQLTDKMRAWRIWAVSLMSLHKKQWDGNKAAGYLLQARGVFDRFYHHSSVVEAAQKMDQDSHQAEYRMRAEMLRDEGKYWQYLASLTGNAEFLDQAIERFNQAIEATQEGTSAWAVATMEREIGQRLKGKAIDWKQFSATYHTVVELSPHAGGWDRKAAVSWWYVKEALLAGRKDDLVLGLNNLRSACQEGKVNWIVHYPLKEISTAILGISRRITYSEGGQYFEAAGHD